MSDSADVLIKVENVGKKFCRSLKRSMVYGIADIGYDLLRLSTVPDKLRRDEFWAVDDVSFEVKRGECLGVIGRNGAGKSTLLKMLNGIILPDKGKITVKGKVGALIEVGAGFHPLLTGRENVYINGAILGMTKREINLKFDEIVAFAELEEFIDMPVKNYSSGMYVRLGFSIAAQMEPDVLILDEVLAVGDVWFRSKCYNAIAKLMPNTALLFVSHSMPQITRIADHALVIDHGKQSYYGWANQAAVEYEKLYMEGSDKCLRTGSKDVQIKSFTILNECGELATSFLFGESIKIRFYLASNINSNVNLIIDFRRADGEVVAECNSYLNGAKIVAKEGESVIVDTVIKNLNLSPGAYSMGFVLISEKNNMHYDWLRKAEVITIKGSQSGCVAQQFKSDWIVEYNPSKDHG